MAAKALAAGCDRQSGEQCGLDRLGRLTDSRHSPRVTGNDKSAGSAPGQVFQAGECPTSLNGVASITFTITGSWTELRLNFQENDAQEVAPFYEVVSPGTYTVTPSMAEVPQEWDVPTAGAVGSSNVQTIQFQVSSQTSSTSFNFCVGNITIN
jgi:hypothetical protein